MIPQTPTKDPFQPRHEPARTIYDAFQDEATKRPGRKDWVKAERERVWSVARDYAQQHGLPVPTLAEVERAEQSACGHVDYGSKWAYGVAELLRRPATSIA